MSDNQTAEPKNNETDATVAPTAVTAAAPARKRKPAARRTVKARETSAAAPAAETASVAPAAKKTAIPLDDPSLYINRELSWIEFDRKVLETAMDPDVPLIERVKFLSIFFNNLDEFFMVRVMNLQRQARSGVEPTGADKVPPAKQLAEIRTKVSDMLGVAEDLWLKTLKPALEKKGIKIAKYSSLTPKRRTALDRYFDREIFPVLTPQAVDAGHPFPMISNTSLNFVVELESVHPSEPGVTRFARIKCPNNVPRFLFIPEDADETTVLDPRAREGAIIMVEDLIGARMEKLFPGYRVKAEGIFRITRNTDGEIEEDEADDLLSAVRDYVEARQFGSIVRVELERGMSQRLQDFLTEHMEVRPYQIYKSKMPLGFSEFMGLGGIDRPGMKYPPFHATMPDALEPDADTFGAIRERDQLFYHPYETFGGLLNFLSKAAKDPNVVAIKQTLYRCGSNSPVVQSLLEARRRGKQVTAVVELKARFDEEQNINWAEKLEAAGVNVIYGFAGLKIHAKLCLVVRREAQGLRRYAHIGTGNYNAGSAKIYTDLGLLTSNDAICDDVQELFNVMTGCGIVEHYRKLFVSPNGIRRNITRLIEEEIEAHKKDGKGHIILKCNQLVDPGMIRSLYEASRAGVKIECIVRGICSLRPGIPGVSDTITVRSVVGRLLEHARVYYFRHGGDERMYIGSADLMSRNLNGRIEVLAPIADAAQRRNVLDQIVRPQLADNIHAWVMHADGTYTKLNPAQGEAVYDSQEEIGKVLNLMKK